MNDQTDKVYQSIFVPEIKIDIANYLTEILIKNYLNWLKIPLPKCPFWRKDIASQNADLKKLSNKYVAELTEVKELLFVFDPSVMAKDFIDNKRIGVKVIKKEQKSAIFETLIQKQISANKSKGKISKTEPLVKREGVSSVSLSNKDSKISL